MTSRKTIVNEILGHLAASPVSGMKKKTVLAHLGNVDVKYFYSIFGELERSGTICCRKDGTYVQSAELSRQNGVFTRNQKGFGFVTLDSGGSDIFILPELTLGALTGDKVIVSVFPELNKRGASGRVLSIVERNRQDFIGCLTDFEGKLGVRPLRRDLPGLLPLKGEVPAGVKVGDWVRVSFEKQETPRSPLTVRISRKISKAGTVAGDLNAVSAEFGIPRKHSSAAEKKAAEIAPADVPRIDCRELEVFTVDPMDAKDYDDGISIGPSYRWSYVEIGVHIADVACFVTRGSSLDKAARLRGFTSYLPGRTIGMLPDALAADRCSLREGVDRPAHSVFLTVHRCTGQVVEARRVHTLIRSRRRLCYEQVDRIIAGEEVPDVSPELARKLLLVYKISARMRKWRKGSEMFLPFKSAETRIICTGKPLRLEGLEKKETGPSGNMIEEFMLAANVAVAQEMSRRKITGFYRNHGEPDKEALAELAAVVSDIMGCKRIKLSSRAQIIRFLNMIKELPYGDIVNMSMLRAMDRATYSTECLGHYGLGKEVYCHFTSPIRRYPDLVIHQQLIAADLGKSGIPREEMEALGEACNALEYNCDQASFALSDRLKLRKLQADQAAAGAEPLECVAFKVSASGVMVFIPAYSIFGFMPVSSFPGYWKYDSNALRQRRRSIYLGKTLTGEPSHIDPIRGELILKPSGGY